MLLKINLFIWFLLAVNLLIARDFYVSPQGDDANSGTESSPWKTLLHATQRVPAGQDHRIILTPGTYQETGQCVLRQKVSLIGAGPGKTILSSNAALWVSSMEGYQIEKFLIKAEGGGQRISGITIDGSNKKLHGGLAVINASQVQIDSLEIRKVFFNGVWLLNVSNSHFHDSEIYDCSWGSSSWAGGAIHLGNLTDVELCNLKIREIEQRQGNRGGGLGIKSLAMTDNRLERVSIKNSTVEVNTYGLWQNNKAPNISIEFHNTEVVDCEISKCALNNTLSLVASSRGIKPDNMRVLHNRLLSSEKSYPLELSMDRVEVAYNYMEGGSGGYAIANWEQKGKRYESWNIHDNVINNITHGWPSSVIKSRGGIKDLIFSHNTIHLYGPPVAILSLYGPNQSENVKISHNLIVRTDNVEVKTEPKSDMLVYARQTEGSHRITQVILEQNNLYNFPVETSGEVFEVTSIQNQELNGTLPLKLTGTKPFPFYSISTSSKIEAGARMP